jgi:hypothetical protein
MSDEVLSFEEYRRRQEENASLVRCARCGKMILATAVRCPECGVHFQGEAQEFTHPSEREPEGRPVPAWWIVVAVILAAALVLGAVGLGLG